MDTLTLTEAATAPVLLKEDSSQNSALNLKPHQVTPLKCETGGTVSPPKEKDSSVDDEGKELEVESQDSPIHEPIALSSSVEGSEAEVEEEEEQEAEANTIKEDDAKLKVKPAERRYLRIVQSEEEVHDSKLSLAKIRAALPKEVYVKSLRRSIQWMLFDFFWIFVGFWGLMKLQKMDSGELFRDWVVEPIGAVGGMINTESLVGSDEVSTMTTSLIDSDSKELHSDDLTTSTMFRIAIQTFFKDCKSLLPISFYSFLPPLFKLSLMLPLHLLSGFFMWSLFVVGHDCGHNTFSNSNDLNFLFGLLTHGFILVPFQPWARSHRFHHMNHNHLENDYSYPWNHEPQYDKRGGSEFLEKHPEITAVSYPILGYGWYLLAPQKFGGVDGSHYFPAFFDGDRLWERVDWEELWKSYVSVIVCIGYGYFMVYNYIGITVYFPSWFFMCFMLYTVTYLQHHSHHTKVFDDSTWTYTTSAFETVDRTYGRMNPFVSRKTVPLLNSGKGKQELQKHLGPEFDENVRIKGGEESVKRSNRYSNILLDILALDIDVLHHHISDCHVVHHLFFTKIPHYNLAKATKALVEYLDKEGLLYLYEHSETTDFYSRVGKYMYEFGTRAKLVTMNEM